MFGDEPYIDLKLKVKVKYRGVQRYYALSNILYKCVLHVLIYLKIPTFLLEHYSLDFLFILCFIFFQWQTERKKKFLGHRTRLE